MDQPPDGNPPFRTNLDEVASMRDSKYLQAMYDREDQREDMLRDPNRRRGAANDNRKPQPPRYVPPPRDLKEELGHEPTMIEAFYAAIAD